MWSPTNWGLDIQKPDKVAFINKQIELRTMAEISLVARLWKIQDIQLVETEKKKWKDKIQDETDSITRTMPDIASYQEKKICSVNGDMILQIITKINKERCLNSEQSDALSKYLESVFNSKKVKDLINKRQKYERALIACDRHSDIAREYPTEIKKMSIELVNILACPNLQEIIQQTDLQKRVISSMRDNNKQK